MELCVNKTIICVRWHKCSLGSTYTHWWAKMHFSPPNSPFSLKCAIVPDKVKVICTDLKKDWIELLLFKK